MKKKLLFIGINFMSCSKIVEEPEYICNNVILEKVDWTYCKRNISLNTWSKCNDSTDTLTMKVKQSIVNIQGKILRQSESSFCLIPDFETSKLNSLTAINLPICYKKDGLKVLFSGDIRITPGLNEANCGDLFEITKISIVK